jgi:hypothetical protein
LLAEHRAELHMAHSVPKGRSLGVEKPAANGQGPRPTEPDQPYTSLSRRGGNSYDCISRRRGGPSGVNFFDQGWD